MPTRNDGKPFEVDNRGAIPRFVIEDNDEGVAILRNQFTLNYEVIGEHPIRHLDPRLIKAAKRLRSREKGHATRTIR